MPDAGDYIYQLSAKIEAICRLLRELDDAFLGNRDSLADRCGIPPNTLKSSCRSNNFKMSYDQQSRLADGVGFSLSEPAWIDPMFRNKEGHDQERRDTAAHFEDILRSLLKPVKHRLKILSTEILDEDLTTFDVSDAQDGPDGGPEFFLELYFEPGVDIDTQDVYGFNRVRVTFNFEGCDGARADRMLGYRNGVSINGATLDYRGHRARPSWHLAVDQGVLEGPFITKDSPLFCLLGAKLGAAIEARLSVQLRDGVVVTRNDKRAGSRAQQAIIKRLRDDRLFNDPDKNGWLDLGIQNIKIVVEDR